MLTTIFSLGGQIDKTLPGLGEVGGLNFLAHFWFLVAVLELISFLLKDGGLHSLIRYRNGDKHV